MKSTKRITFAVGIILLLLLAAAFALHDGGMPAAKAWDPTVAPVAPVAEDANKFTIQSVDGMLRLYDNTGSTRLQTEELSEHFDWLDTEINLASGARDNKVISVYFDDATAAVSQEVFFKNDTTFVLSGSLSVTGAETDVFFIDSATVYFENISLRNTGLLGGHTLICADSGSTAVLRNATLSAGTRSSRTVFARSDARLYIEDGTTVNGGLSAGYTVDMNADAVLYMNGGAVNGSLTGAVGLWNNARFTLKGGTVSSSATGRGVYLASGSNAQFAMNGGNVSASSLNGKAIYAEGGTLYLAKGTVSSSGNGSFGVYLVNATATIDAQAFGDVYVTARGTGIYASQSTLNMTNAEIDAGATGLSVADSTLTATHCAVYGQTTGISYDNDTETLSLLGETVVENDSETSATIQTAGAISFAGTVAVKNHYYGTNGNTTATAVSVLSGGSVLLSDAEIYGILEGASGVFELDNAVYTEANENNVENAYVFRFTDDKETLSGTEVFAANADAYIFVANDILTLEGNREGFFLASDGAPAKTYVKCTRLVTIYDEFAAENPSYEYDAGETFASWAGFPAPNTPAGFTFYGWYYMDGGLRVFVESTDTVMFGVDLNADYAMDALSVAQSSVLIEEDYATGGYLLRAADYVSHENQDAEYTYVWAKRTTNILGISSYETISGATEAEYRVQSAADSGVYRVSVTARYAGYTTSTEQIVFTVNLAVSEIEVVPGQTSIQETYVPEGYTVNAADYVTHAMPDVVYTFQWEKQNSILGIYDYYEAISGATNAAYTFKNVAESGTYRVTVKASYGGDAGTETTAQITFTVNIAKADPEPPAMETFIIIYGQTLADVNLPEGVQFDDPARDMSRVDSYVLDGTFTALETPENYNVMPVSIRVNVRPLPIAEPTYGDLTFVYDGTEKSITVSASANESYYVTGIGTATNAGTYTVYVQLVNNVNYCWDNSYKSSAPIILTWTITPAVYEGEILFEDATFVYDGNAKTIVLGSTLPDGLTVSYSGGGKTEVGVYTVTANFAGANYVQIPAKQATLTIVYPITVKTEGIASDFFSNYVAGAPLASAPAKEGYNFAGWYTTADFSGTAVTLLTDLSAATTLYAKYTPVPVTPPVPEDPADDEKEGLSGGAIAGIVVGSVAGAALIAGAVLFFLKKKKKAK